MVRHWRTSSPRVKEETGGRKKLSTEGAEKVASESHNSVWYCLQSRHGRGAGTVAEQKDQLLQPPSARRTGGVTLVSSRHTAPSQQWLHKSLQLEFPSSPAAPQNPRLLALLLAACFSLVEHPLPLQDGGPDRIVRHFVLLYRLLLSILGVISVWSSFVFRKLD